MSDEEEQYDPKSHRKLLQAIGNLGTVQHIRKSTRNELQPHQDEFHLVKNITGAVSDVQSSKAVGVNDLVQILKTSSKHIETGKRLKNVHNTKKVLEKPLEKPAADRIRRKIRYEGVKKQLGRWDAVVANQRSAETQIFPLPTETIYINTSAHVRKLQTSVKSDLAKELAASDMKLRAMRKARAGDTTDENELAKRESEQLQKKLTRDELHARRKELAYLKMRESQKSAKARMQNKIKSKKYHKLMKRQKMLEQVKEFEILQKTNPEAALEKLNALEKSRVLERASLRHKNTGTWAKNLQVRAKYDKDVRKDLAEQLAVSRELTGKKQEEESDEEQIDAEAVVADDDYDPFNPWTKSKMQENGDKRANTEDANWRKYWLERNKNNKLLEEHRAEIATAQLEQTEKAVDAVEKVPKTKPIKEKRKKSGVIVENGWLVEEVDPIPSKNGKIKSIDEIFEQHEDRVRQKLSKKLQKITKRAESLKEKLTEVKNPQKKKKKDELKNLKDLMFKKTKQRPDIDEALNTEDADKQATSQTELERISEVNKSVEKAPTPRTAIVDTIDPNKVATIKLIQTVKSSELMNDALGNEEDAEYDDEGDAAAERQLTISQAFEDDDIVADFNKAKTDDSEIKNTELQLSMPGWGSWAGAGISQEVVDKRNKRLLLKLAVPEKRRDDNKDNLYINEAASKQARAHMVSTIPFPFKSLADYEASIRAPIGRNFVPETAFRMLTRPAVITRKGAIIEPMDESELVKPDRRLRHVVDRRIKRLGGHAPKVKKQ